MTETSFPLSRRTLLQAAAASLLAPAAAYAAFPDRPLHIVVPFAPGGGTDGVARALGEGMARALGQPVIIDNKPGAGTVIGTDFVAKAPADGYTIVLSTFAHAVNSSLMPKLPYAADKAFAPVALVGRAPNVLVVRADSAFRSVQDVVSRARAQPGKLSYGSYGNGTSAHLAAELFKNLAKVDITHVPYKGSAPAITDLLGGQVDMIFTTAPSAAPQVTGGRLRAIALTSAEPSAAWPGIPTVAQGGVPGYVAESWYGLYAPAGTPPAVIAQLHAAARTAAQSESFRKRAQEEGMVLATGAPEELDRYVRAEEARWRRVVQDARITVD